MENPVVGHVYFRCPDPYQWTLDEETDELSRDVPILDCLKCSLTRPERTCHWDFTDLVDRIDRSPMYASFTPSKMLGCVREQWYRMNTAYAIDPQSKHAMVRGTRWHSGAEVGANVKIDGQPITDFLLSEVTVVRLLDVPWKGRVLTLPITVRPDKVYPQLGLIHDDKTRGYLQSQNKEAIAPPTSEDYRFQLSVGAWAWADPWVAVYPDQRTDHVPEPLIIHTGQITYRDAQKQVRVGEIPLIPDEALEDRMVEECQRQLALYDDNYKAPHLEGDAAWRCGNCPFSQGNGGECPGVPEKKAPAPRKKPVAPTFTPRSTRSRLTV